MSRQPPRALIGQLIQGLRWEKYKTSQSVKNSDGHVRGHENHRAAPGGHSWSTWTSKSSDTALDSNPKDEADVQTSTWM